MKKITIISILIISLSKIVFGCTCYMTESFDIRYYDESMNIAEIKVIDKVEDDYGDKLSQYKKDTIGWDKEYPPIPMAPPNNFTEFNVEVIELFKGKLIKGKIRLKANEKNSSCYWEPEVGKTYIFYYGKTIEQKDKKSIEIGGCQRRIQKGSKNYASELEALRVFKEKKEGEFIVDQSKLMNSSNKTYYTVKGKFKNGTRHGKWIISEPISNSKIEKKPRKNVLLLKYKNGKLMSIKYSKPYNNHVENNFTRHWKHYYEERKL